MVAIVAVTKNTPDKMQEGPFCPHPGQYISFVVFRVIAVLSVQGDHLLVWMYVSLMTSLTDHPFTGWWPSA